MVFLLFLLFPFLSGAFTFPEQILEPQEPILPRIKIADKRPFFWIPKAKSYRLWSSTNGVTAFDTVVNFNKNGFRVTYKDNGVSSGKIKHLILAGCSVTFGHGLSDEETFPFLLGERFKNHNVVNFGFRGTSPQDHLYFLRAMDLSEIIHEEEGVMIYTLIPDHFERISRTWRYLAWAYHHSTVFKEINGDLIYDGVISDKWDFRVTRSLKRNGFIYWWLRLTNLHSDYLSKGSDRMMLKILSELKKSYLAQFPRGRFLVTFMSGPSPEDHEWYRRFREGLDINGIEFWSPDSKVPDPKSTEATMWQIPGDGHPNALANRTHFEFLRTHLEDKDNFDVIK